MNQQVEPSPKFRYIVDSGLFEITPLAEVQLFLGNYAPRVLNISMGGVAFLLEKSAHFEENSVLDVSISLRGRPFRSKLEIRKIGGLRISAQFVSPVAAFSAALREYLTPKSLGASLQLQTAQKDLPEALALVPGSESYEPYVGQNNTGVFVWMGSDRKLLRILAVGRDLVLGWESQTGFRTGKIAPDSPLDVSWDRIPEITVHNYLADIIVAWMSRPEERSFVEELFQAQPGAETTLRFPLKP